MRLLRDKQPVKYWQPFSLRIGTQGCNVMYILTQIREGECLKEYMRYYTPNGHKFHKKILKNKKRNDRFKKEGI
jgi:hypothetical protein